MRKKLPLKTSSRKWFYEKNTRLLNHPVNKTFDEILLMSNRQFREWIAELRQVVIDLWDNRGLPPVVGLNEDEIIEQFDKIESFRTEWFLIDDIYEKTKRDVIRNTSIVGNAASQFFPTMMKTRINYTSNIEKGRSIYDHFKDDELIETMVTYGRRHFKRDSFYHYSRPVPYRTKKPDEFIYCASTGVDWITRFEKDARVQRQTYDYWIEPITTKADYTGYNEKLRKVKYLTITKAQLNKLSIPKKCKTNIKTSDDDKVYRIRLYKKGQRLFPPGLKAFRVSFAQYAVNFPVLTAKFLYERYAKELRKDKITIWDPSAGWGGRILGAMGVQDIKVHYIGTDPNTDHNTSKGRTKYHELADFYNKVRIGEMDGHVKLPWLVWANTYEIYQCGSEDMHKQKEFQKYKGKIDIVFTSPPYFAKELYSDDAAQSARKFNEYSRWRDGFLKPTLETACQWLQPGGYLLWNIADAKFGNEMLPLEHDSCAIIEQLGMRSVEKLKMALGSMPGANRVKEEEGEEIIEIGNDLFGAEEVKMVRGKPNAKNFCQIKSGDKKLWIKYEPIFVYQKPR